jgi:hypothetical protein
MSRKNNILSELKELGLDIDTSELTPIEIRPGKGIQLGNPLDCPDDLTAILDYFEAMNPRLRAHNQEAMKEFTTTLNISSL